MIDLATLYPDGRTFYYEGDDLPSFIETVHGLDLCPATNYPPPGRGLDPFTTVYVPAKRLDAFYALDLRVGT